MISKPTHRTQEFPSLSKPATATPQQGILFCRKREEGKIKSDIDVSRRRSSWKKRDARSDAIRNTSNVRQISIYLSIYSRESGVERRLISQGLYFSSKRSIRSPKWTLNHFHFDKKSAPVCCLDCCCCTHCVDDVGSKVWNSPKHLFENILYRRFVHES